MTKFFKTIKILQESLIRNCSSKNYLQPSKYLLPSDVEGKLLQKRHKNRKAAIHKIQRSIWCLGSNLEGSFLFEIPPTVTFARGFSSRYMIPPKTMSKMGSKKTCEDDRLTIIPTWMKKTKIKKFQDNMGNVKNNNQNISQTKNLHEFNPSGPKFKMTNLINKKSKTMQLMTESLKSKRFYKTVMNRIALPHFETKHLVLKKKNYKKESLDSQSVPEDSMKEVINTNIPGNYKLTMSNKADHNRNKQAGEPLTLEYIRNSPEPLKENVENNIEKSLMVVPENKLKKPNKNDDRSRIRRYKAKNVIAEKNEKLLKLNSKHFEKPEVDMFIKKLAAKYGKTAVQKTAKPKRIYENNRPRIKYDLNTDKYFINKGNAGIMNKHITTTKIETKISNHTKKKLNEFFKKNIENSRVLKKGNNLLVNQRTTPYKIEEKPKRGTIVRKEDLTAEKKLETAIQFVNKKANSAIKLNSKNGFLKDRDKHVSAEKRKKTFEIESSSNSANVVNDVQECTILKSSKDCQNNKKNIKDQMITYAPKNIGNSLIIANPDCKKLQKEVISSNDGNYELSTNVNKFNECNKTDDKSQILLNKQNNNIIKLTMSDILSNKRNEHPLKIENVTGESKNKQTKDQSTATLEEQRTEPSKNNSKEKGQHMTSMVDTSSNSTEQMKYTPDSPNYICDSKKRIVSCKYKMARGVHSDKPDISRISKRHLRNTQPDFKLNNEISLNHRPDNSKITNKEETSINVNKNLPSKVEFVKTIDTKLLVPMKIYKFHCHCESLDYKVYKHHYSPSVSLKQSNNIKTNINDIKTGNLEQTNTLKKERYQCFESQKRQIDSKNRILANVNTVRVRFPSIINFKNTELTAIKEVVPKTAKQPANYSVRSTKGKNSPSIFNKVLDTKDLTLNSENQLKSNSELSRQIKEKHFIPIEKVEDERNAAEKEEKSNCANTKIVQTTNLKKQIKDEDGGAEYGTGERDSCIIDNKIALSRVTREMHKTEGYNLDYSRKELKKILPFLKQLSNKTINNCSKEERNSESIESKEEKEKKLLIGKDTILSNTRAFRLEIPNKNYFMPFISAIKNKSGLNNKHYNPDIFLKTYSEEQSKKDDLKASVRKNPKFEVQKNKQLEEIHFGNHIDSNCPFSQQLADISEQGNVSPYIMESKTWNSNIEKNIFPTFENKTGMNDFYYEDTTYKHKKELGIQNPTMTTGMQKKQHKMQSDQKSTSWMDIFHELVINKHILIKKMKKNVFLMHGFNKVSFLKVFEDFHHVTSEMNIFPKHIPMIAINTNYNERELSKNKINELQVLENDLKTMLCQQLELYNREHKHKYPKTIKQNEYLKIYDLFDCSLILQCSNKKSLNGEPPQNLAKENVCQSSTSSNDFEFINSTTEKKCDKTVPMQAETNKDDSNTIKQIKTDGRLIVKQNPDVSIIEVLDCTIRPKKCTKSTVKESSSTISEEMGSQMFSLINSKHMCFFSKYRMNCMGENVIMKYKKAISDEEPENKNTSIVTNTNIKHNSSTDMKYLESIPKSSFQRKTILPISLKMSTFQEIYDYNHRKNFGIEDKQNKVNEFSQLEDKEKKYISTKRNSEKESLLNAKQEDKSTNLYSQTSFEPNIGHSFTVKENPNREKIEPEVLNYMKKLDNILCSNNGLTMHSNNTKTLEKNTNEVFFKTETIQEKSFRNLESNEHSSYKIKNASEHSRDEAIKTRNRFMKEISYSTDIKLLEKNTTNLSEVINKCKKSTFEYLTKVIKKHKMDTIHPSNLSSSNINEKLEKSDEILASKNHKDIENVKISPLSPQISTLASPILKMITDKDISKDRSNLITKTNFVSIKNLKASDNNNPICNHLNSEMLEASKNDIEIDIRSPNVKTLSLNKNIEDEHKAGINSNQTEDIFAQLVENSVNKLNVVKNIKEQENQLFHLKNLENNEKCDITGGNNQITSCNKKLKPSNMLNTVDVPIQNELISLVNIDSTNIKSPHNNINHVQKDKTESDSKIRLTAGMNNVKTPNNTFEGICIKNEDLKTSKNIIKTTNAIQNYSNDNRARKKTHLQSDNTKISNDLSKAVCKVRTVLNKKYASRIQTCVNNENKPNLSLRRDEVKNLTKTLKSQKVSRNLDKTTEKDMKNEFTVEEQKEVEKTNISEVLKPLTDYKNNEHITYMNTKIDLNTVEGSKPVKNERNDIKTIINKKINISNSHESDITESIPTGLRCIRQLKIEADRNKEKEKCYLKKPFCTGESIKLKDRERNNIKSHLRKEIGKSVAITKETLTADCGTTQRLNQYLMKHKKQLEIMTKDKRVKSIKNKLSNNLKPRDEIKIISRKSHTLMSFRHAECGKMKSEDSKKDIKKENEDELHSLKSSNNKIVSFSESKEQSGSARNKICKAPETGHFYNSNFFVDSNPIKMASEVKKPSFNIICSENNFKPINEYKDKGFCKAENMELNFTQQEANVKKQKNKEINNIASTSSHSFKNNIRTNQKNKYRENPIYILKDQPNVTEGFISQTLRSSNLQKNLSSKMGTGTVKKRQASHLMKYRIKSELKQSAISLKKKISKHRLLKTDLRFKNDQKKHQSYLKLAQPTKIFSQKELPLHIFQKEQKNAGKNYLLDTPSRQVCGITPPRQTPKQKPLMPKGKVTTKLIACTQQKDIDKQNFKVEKTVWPQMCQLDKGNTSAQNLSEYQFDKSEAEELKDESKDQNTSSLGTKDLISDIELIIDQGIPATGLAVKVPDGNNISKCELMSSSKNDIGLPSIVGNVVNNVKSRIQSFLLTDIAKSTLNRGITSKKRKQQGIDDFKENRSITKSPKIISKKKNVLTKLDQNTEQILCCTTNQVEPEKKKMKTINNNKDDSQRRKTIADLLTFKPVRNKLTCPQMSYSEVLNKFYAGYET